jgi:hypothetical protein
MSHVIFTPITNTLDKYCINYHIQWIKNRLYNIFLIISIQENDSNDCRLYKDICCFIFEMWQKKWIKAYWLILLWFFFSLVEIRSIDDDCISANFYIELSFYRWNMRQELMISPNFCIEWDLFYILTIYMSPHFNVLNINLQFYSLKIMDAIMMKQSWNYFFNQMFENNEIFMLECYSVGRMYLESLQVIYAFVLFILTWTLYYLF